MVNGGNFIGYFYMVWNIYTLQERGRKIMDKKIKEIYQFLLSETEYLKEAGKDVEKATESFLKKVLSVWVKMTMKKFEMNYLQ